MTREEAIRCLSIHSSTNGSGLCTDKQHYEAKQMAIKALSQEPLSEIKENISKYMKKYPNHVGNIDFWNGFYACRNIVEHLDEDEQEPCDDAISRNDMLDAIGHGTTYTSEELQRVIQNLPPVTQKSETVTEFADRCRECGARYGKLLEQKSEKRIEGRKTSGYIKWNCSECGLLVKNSQKPWYKFCPNCGAKMERSE